MKRIENDFYPTEEALTKYLLKTMSGLLYDTEILEPCAGQNHIARVLEHSGLCVHTSDIVNDPKCDATKACYWQDVAPDCDWVITNPPFNQAHLIIPQALNHAKRGIAMLLRLSYQEPCANRADWLKANNKHLRWVIIFCNPRPRFRADTGNSDSVTTAWMVWDKEWEGGTNIVYANDWKDS